MCQVEDILKAEDIALKKKKIPVLMGHHGDDILRT